MFSLRYKKHYLRMSQHVSELQIIGGIEDNSKTIFLISHVFSGTVQHY